MRERLRENAGREDREREGQTKREREKRGGGWTEVSWVAPCPKPESCHLDAPVWGSSSSSPLASGLGNSPPLTVQSHHTCDNSGYMGKSGRVRREKGNPGTLTGGQPSPGVHFPCLVCAVGTSEDRGWGSSLARRMT